MKAKHKEQDGVSLAKQPAASRAKSTEGKVMIKYFSILLTAVCLLPSLALAHPGAGIVVDRLGQVYFVATGSGGSSAAGWLTG
jgi:hypothetical protein